MIEPATKYGSVAGVQRAAPAPRRLQIGVQTFGRVRAPGMPAVFLPRFKTVNIRWDEYMDREMREGGYLHTYLRREKHTSTRRQRRAARAMQGFRQNNQSDLRLAAAVPAREFFRWKQEDPDFWRDPKNLKSLKRDGAEFPIYE